MRVLMAEQLTDDDLLAYAVTGSKVVTYESHLSQESAKNLPWLDKNMWSDILYLQSLAPFNKANLTDHILKNHF